MTLDEELADDRAVQSLLGLADGAEDRRVCRDFLLGRRPFDDEVASAAIRALCIISEVVREVAQLAHYLDKESTG